MSNLGHLRRFWDARAEENPMYYIDNTLDYRRPSAEDFWAHGAAELDRLLGAVGARIEPSDEVVEIGCGIGRMTRAVAAGAASVRAVDVSPRMLERARALGGDGGDGGEVEWILGDGATLGPIGDASADVCLSHVVFQHIPDPEITLGYLREIGRVLRPRGWAAFQISNDPAIHRRRRGREGLAIGWRALRGRGPRGQADPAWLGAPVALDAVRRAAAEGGMDVVRVAGEGRQLCFVRTAKRAQAGG
jgi:SAM-dependent methyltransferase